MRKTVDVLGIPVDAVTMAEAVEKVGRFIEEGGKHVIFTPNAEIIMQAQRDSELKDILKNADMLTADGAGVVLASGMLGNRLPEKVSGVDLVQEIFRTFASRGLRCFLFGARPGVAEEAAVNIIKDNPGIVVAGCRNGYFSDEECDEIIAEINKSAPDILLVALGAPKQEKWISKHLDKLDVKVCIGVGGTWMCCLARSGSPLSFSGNLVWNGFTDCAGNPAELKGCWICRGLCFASSRPG